MCVLASTRPGSTVSLERSITVAPEGIATLTPTSLILSPSIRMTTLVEDVPVSGSIRLPPLVAVVRAGCDCCAWAASTRQTATRAHNIQLIFFMDSSVEIAASAGGPRSQVGHQGCDQRESAR